MKNEKFLVRKTLKRGGKSTGATKLSKRAFRDALDCYRIFVRGSKTQNEKQMKQR